MAHFTVLPGDKKDLAKPRTSTERLRDMNPRFAEALKLGKLDFDQRRVFERCLERFPLPESVDGASVIQAIADPEKDLLEDYRETDPAVRTRWHALLAALGIGTEAQKRHDEVKRRLGLVRRVLGHANGR